MKDLVLSRRRCLQVSALAGCSMFLRQRVPAAAGTVSVDHSQPATIAPQVTGELRSLLEKLAKAPRRRDFKTVPMILDTADLWDAEALDASAKLLAKGINPDGRSHPAIAAELTNHLIEGVVLTPGISGTIPKLQEAGFHYAT